MFESLWLIPALPLAGFLILALMGKRLPQSLVATVAVGSVGLATALTLWIGLAFVQTPPDGRSYSQVLWTWMQVDGFAPTVGFYLDAASLVMVSVVTFVSLLIHIYSTRFMDGDEGYSRFFAYMNLFVSSMLILVLADDLLLLYLGWEGVGLCSYLLIGYWYEDPANVVAANKAFIVTRIGDAAMAIGLFILYQQLGTLNIQEVLQRAVEQWSSASVLPVTVAALLLGGAVGKSAQLPLQTWLPDAMAGPTPVSALIHAATMVTAGVYLIARMHAIYSLAPVIQTLVAVVGAVTLLLAGFSALVQYDIKRVLAYSTISQIGYMFLALGVGAWSAALFHLMTHAFFKALLFLGAGVVISSLHHEHDMFKMGGLRRQLPITFWTFLIGSASLAAVPLCTAGFYSKDSILLATWTAPAGSGWLWLAGIAGALLTSLYTFRMVFLTFFGPAQQQISGPPARAMQIPLIILAVFSVLAGFINLPVTLGGASLFSDWLAWSLPATEGHASFGLEAGLQIAASVVSLFGIYLAYLLFLRAPEHFKNWMATPVGGALERFWFAGWGFDWVYNTLLVRPFIWIAHVDRRDVIDLPFQGVAWLSGVFWKALSKTQTGNIRWYAAAVAVGAILAIAFVEVIR